MVQLQYNMCVNGEVFFLFCKQEYDGHFFARVAHLLIYFLTSNPVLQI